MTIAVKADSKHSQYADVWHGIDDKRERVAHVPDRQFPADVRLRTLPPAPVKA
jgi:hypothetical protein